MNAPASWQETFQILHMLASAWGAWLGRVGAWLVKAQSLPFLPATLAEGQALDPPPTIQLHFILGLCLSPSTAE